MKNSIITKQTFNMNLENELSKDELHSNTQIQTKQKAPTENALKQKGLGSFKNEIKNLDEKNKMTGSKKNEQENNLETKNQTPAIEALAANNIASVLKGGIIKPEETQMEIKNVVKNINDIKAETPNLEFPKAHPLEISTPQLTLPTAANPFLNPEAPSKEVKTIEVKANDKTINIEENDALFFAQLVSGANMVTKGQEITQLPMVKDGQTTPQEPVKISTALMNLIEDAYKANKPLRINFDKNLSVIIRMDSKGAISAEFIPGDKAMEEYLRKNIPMLQERFNQQELQYNELNYRRRNQQQNNKENNQNKEGKNE